MLMKELKLQFFDGLSIDTKLLSFLTQQISSLSLVELCSLMRAIARQPSAYGQIY
jgi:hypothetical protein